MQSRTRVLRAIMDSYAALAGSSAPGKLPSRPVSKVATSHLVFGPTKVYEVPESAKMRAIPSLQQNAANLKSLRVSLLGLPNSGKSSLLNALVKAPVAAVSPKSHTTREQITGFAETGNFQLVVDDLPGLVAVRQSAEIRKFVASAWDAAAAADVRLLVVDVTRRVDPEMARVLRTVGQAQDGLVNISPVVLILNKVDSLAPNSPALQLRRRELEQIFAGTDVQKFERVFFCSAKNGNGVGRLGADLEGRAENRAWLFAAGTRTSLSRVEQVEQQTRGLLYTWFNRDLPYKLRPTVVAWEEDKDGNVAIEQELRVKDTVVARMVLGVRNRLLQNLETNVADRLHKLWNVNVRMKMVVRAEKVRQSRKDRQEATRLWLCPSSSS